MSDIESLKQDMYSCIKKQTRAHNFVLIFMLLFIVVFITYAIGVFGERNLAIMFVMIVGVLLFMFIPIIYSFVQVGKIYGISRKAEDLVKQKYRLEKIPFHPSFELKIKGDYSDLLRDLEQLFYRYEMKRVKLNTKKKKVTGSRSVIAGGLMRLNFEYALIRRAGFQRVSGQIVDETSRGCTLILTVAGPYKGFDYDLLKELEKQLS